MAFTSRVTTTTQSSFGKKRKKAKAQLSALKSKLKY